MKINNWLVALALVVPACDGGNSDETGSTGGTAETGGTTMETPTGGGDEGDAQTPPMGHDAVQAWLAAGHYKMWKNQPAVVDPIPISPHGKQRIYTNDLLSSHGTGEYPVGTASVKELYDDAGTNIVGYSVYLHVSAGMTGANWYWYEVVGDTPSSDGVDVAYCVGCHSAAGIDVDHPGHDFVYTQLP
jgi:hypothetical protein